MLLGREQEEPVGHDDDHRDDPQGELAIASRHRGHHEPPPRDAGTLTSPLGASCAGGVGLNVTVRSNLYRRPQLSRVVSVALWSRTDSLSSTSVTRYICSSRTIMRAVSDWCGVHPIRLAVGPVGTPAVAGVATAVGSISSATLASVVWTQLSSGITRESSRMKRSQSKRVSAAPMTDASRCSLMPEKSVKASSCLA